MDAMPYRQGERRTSALLPNIEDATTLLTRPDTKKTKAAAFTNAFEMQYEEDQIGYEEKESIYHCSPKG